MPAQDVGVRGGALAADRCMHSPGEAFLYGVEGLPIHERFLSMFDRGDHQLGVGHTGTLLGAERDVVDVEKDFGAGDLVPDLVTEVPGVGEDGAHR
jgi:hypothetical protein